MAVLYIRITTVSVESIDVAESSSTCMYQIHRWYVHSVHAVPSFVYWAVVAKYHMAYEANQPSIQNDFGLVTFSVSMA